MADGNATRLLTLSETAERLRVSQRTVERFIDRDGLPCYRIGRGVRIEERDLEEWLADRREGARVRRFAKVRGAGVPVAVTLSAGAAQAEAERKAAL